MAIDFEFDDGDLVVRISGWDIVWSLHRTVRVPVGAIERVYVQAKDPLQNELAFRIRGGSMPGVVMAGRFSVWKKHRTRDGERQFWLTKRAAEVLVIDTDVASPARLVLEVPEPRALQRELSDRIARHDDLAA